MHAIPKPPAGTRRAKAQDAERRRFSRAEARYGRNVAPPMPPNPAPGITNRLIEVGLQEAVGMGVGPLSWQEIEAWQRITGAELPGWEARLIRRLSTEYVAESRLAEDEGRPPPWRAPVTQREVDLEEDRLRSVLG